MKFDNYEILLGSGSPRRRELLAAMDIPFGVIKLNDVEEVYPADLKSEKVPVYLSALKASSYAASLKEGQLLITADTVVIADGEILGKPVDAGDARKMLRRLAGREHHVVSGVTLTTTERSVSFSESTAVWFADLSDAQIDYYLDSYKPFDKAGAYGIQEWIGMVAITRIDGCFYNVMGLPTAALYRHLIDFMASK